MSKFEVASINPNGEDLRKYIMGIDVGHSNDFTCITVLSTPEDEALVAHERLRKEVRDTK